MATLDVLTIEEARSAINVSDQTHDAELFSFVAAVSKRLDELIGPVVNRTVTEYHDGDCHVIRPRQTPLSSVTTLKEAAGTSVTTLTAETFGVIPADAYLVDDDGAYAHRCRIYRRSGGRDWNFAVGSTDARRNVELVYVAGRASDTESVDRRIKNCASSILRRLWKREAGTWAQSSTFFTDGEQSPVSGFYRAVDPMVKEMLADELKVAVTR